MGKLTMEIADSVHETITTSKEEAVVKEEELKFDPSRMIGIIKRKALIKDLATAYHVECIACGQELLQLQKRWEQHDDERRAPVETRKLLKRPAKRSKKEH